MTSDLSVETKLRKRTEEDNAFLRSNNARLLDVLCEVGKSHEKLEAKNNALKNHILFLEGVMKNLPKPHYIYVEPTPKKFKIKQLDIRKLSKNKTKRKR